MLSLLQGSLNEAIKKAASAAAQAAANAFDRTSPPALAPINQGSESFSNKSAISSATVPQVPGSSPANRFTGGTTMDSVHELSAKPVKEVLSDELMELSNCSQSILTH